MKKDWEAAQALLSSFITGKARGQGGKPWEDKFDCMYNYLDVSLIKTR